MTTIYVELLDEAVDVWRPVQAVDLGDGRYRIETTDDYDPSDEKWRFLPGATVECELRVLADGPCLVAVRELAT